MYRQMILFCVSLGRSIRKGLITKLSKPSLLAPHPKCFELFPMEGSAHNISGCAFVTHVTSINCKEIWMHRSIDTHMNLHMWQYQIHKLYYQIQYDKAPPQAYIYLTLKTNQRNINRFSAR